MTLGETDGRCLEAKAFMAGKIVFAKEPPLESAAVFNGGPGVDARLLVHSQGYRWNGAPRK